MSRKDWTEGWDDNLSVKVLECKKHNMSFIGICPQCYEELEQVLEQYQELIAKIKNKTREEDYRDYIKEFGGEK